MAKDKLIQSKPEQEVMDQKELEVKNSKKSQYDKDYMDGIFGGQIYSELMNGCYSNMDEDHQAYRIVFESMRDIKPRDHIEKMLVAQMLTTHHSAMKCFKRASSCFGSSQIPTLEMGNTILNSATKLVRTYTMQMEALNRYRGKGQQKITVEHVSINSGGKAVIGNINSTKEIKTQEDGRGEEVAE